ncbi:MAG: hypothetical protein UV78_C0003G0012 [Parcubacteria group bacterium GW2011_GWA2_43_17]|jgi:hypothetical protein|nr:MAG: hypothetical protein UV78_C0003G0012 [Parcubacteria group bacterium GW2011_GWA2_43_17]
MTIFFTSLFCVNKNKDGLLVSNKKSIDIIRTGDAKVNKVEIFELKSAWD